MASLKIKFIFFFASFLCLNSSVMAAQWAVVTAKKAPVFSDVQMSSVIGFIGQGKRLRVGEVPKNKGRVLPIIVNKKIAYIQVDDIAISTSKEAIFSATKRIQSKMNEKSDVKKISLVGGLMYANVAFDDTERNEASYNLAFYDLGIRGYYRNLGEVSGLRSGFVYTQGEREEEKLSSFYIHIDYTLPLISTRFYDMLFFAGGLVSPYVEYEVDSLFDITGYGLGAHSGIDMSFELPGNWSLNVDGSYFLMKTFDLNLPDNAFYGKELNPLINGIRTTVGFTYEY
ncbi:MAG: hypothetical protein CME65_14140 [Halobacteriovoraceae bacterium]|nr:hypothetical protein [Halobacteriovoraceae bacterium]|tara:strand:- start:2723 stop:3577 length:855 start_codon:yes stop_codon:yes gene_type:complete